MKIKNLVIDNIKFTPDCQNKWNFDGPIIVTSSRGYNRNEKSFYVGYYLVIETDENNECIYDSIPIIEDELFAYFGNESGNCGYAIHISDLKIFDKPKELSEFYKLANQETNVVNDAGWYCEPITKAPQNYCYVEIPIYY